MLAMFDLTGVFSIEGLISVLTLTVLEIVLGIDNIIFISIVAGKLPKDKQPYARRLGLSLALIIRIILLFGLAALASLSEPFYTIMDFPISGRDIIMLAGGIFLIAKSTTEIHSKVTLLEEGEHLKGDSKSIGLNSAILQIVMLDIVFSFDSILTAVGLVTNVALMVTAVVISLIVMLIFSGPVSDFVNKNPTIKILALSFLLMIGFLLILDGFHVHVPKGYIYFAMAFSLLVEMLNMQMRKQYEKSMAESNGKEN